MREFVINKNDGGQRLDKFVSKTVWGLPPSLMYKFIRKKRIKVNGKRAEEKQILRENDIVEMYIPDEFFEKKSYEISTEELSRLKPRITVVYEDKNIIICDKSPGVLSHNGDDGENESGKSSERETLLFHIKAYLYQRGEWDPKEENSFAPALCNRIDRNTGGLVIGAKNAQALRHMNELIKNGNVHKKYLCAVHGKPNPSSATLKAFLFKNSKTKTVRVSENETRGSKEIITKYTVLDYNKEYDLSLLEVSLLTGRTHQIRAHMAFIGHPLLGEGKYAENREDRALGYSYQALYSYKVSFDVSDGVLKNLDKREFTVEQKSVGFLKLFPRYRI